MNEQIFQDDMIYDETKLMESCGKLFQQCACSIAPDIMEVGVDYLLKDGILKEIPGVNVVVAIGNFIIGVVGETKTKHILVFTQKLINGELSYKIVKKHFENMRNHPKKMMHEVETLVESIMNHSKYIKDQILANFYLLYCNPDVEFGWSEFEMYNEIIRNLFPYDLITLQQIYCCKKYTDFSFDRPAMRRLNNLGLVRLYEGAPGIVYRSSEEVYTAKIEPLGEFFWEQGMKEVKLHHEIDDEERIL